MKKIPEKFELDQDDIEDAITEWLNNNATEGGDDFRISFKRETRTVDSPKNPPRGGMSEPVEEYHFTAVAEKLP